MGGRKQRKVFDSHVFSVSELVVRMTDHAFLFLACFNKNSLGSSGASTMTATDEGHLCAIEARTLLQLTMHRTRTTCRFSDQGHFPWLPIHPVAYYAEIASLDASKPHWKTHQWWWKEFRTLTEERQETALHSSLAPYCMSCETTSDSF